MADEKERARTTASIILATLAVVAALYYGHDFLMPIGFALVLDVLFRPAVRWMGKIHVPAPVGGAIVVLALLGAFVGGGYALAAPLREWMAEAPKHLTAAQTKLE